MARIPIELKLRDLRNLQQIDEKISGAISNYDNSLNDRDEALKNEIKNLYEDKISGIEDYINDGLASQLEKLNGGMDELQKQLDGEVNAWFKLEYPVIIENETEYVNLEISPITEWMGENYNQISDYVYELKEGCKNELINHIGDTYTNLEEFVSEEETPLAGKSWRWCDATSMIEAERISSEGCICVKYMKGDEEKETYLHWHLITDSDALRALELAKGAQSTADGKSTIFISIDQDGDRVPNNYKIGDMWILNDFALKCEKSGFGIETITSGNTEITKYYYLESNEKVYITSGEILTANKNSINYDLTHWSKQVKYTDDTIANIAIGDATEAKQLANSAQREAEAARDRLNNWSADGVISPLEMQGIKDELKRIKSDLDHIVAEYEKYGDILSGVTGLTVDLPVDFDENNVNGAYYKYHYNLQEDILNGTKNEDGSVNIPENFADNQTIYYSARTEALLNISNFSNFIVDVYIEKSINTGKIKEAIKASEDNINETLGKEIEKLNGGLKNLEEQLDGEVSSYFLMGAPVVIENEISKVRVDVEPILTWLSNYEQEETTGVYTLKEGCRNELINNIGDTYTNNEEFVSEEETPLAGKSWRWCDATVAVNTGQTSSEECIRVKYTKDDVEKEVYLHWHAITDSSTLEALNIAKKAQSTADGKSTIFVSIDQDGDRVPNNYKIGDLWIINDFALNYEGSGFGKETITSGDTNITKYYYTEDDKKVYVSSGEILTANKQSDIYDLTHWSTQVKYTDDTLASQALSDAASANMLAASANATAEAARDRLNNWSADGVISPLEMQGIKDELKRIKSDLDHIVAEYEKYGEILSGATGLTVDLPVDFDENNAEGAYYKYHYNLQEDILNGTKNEDGSVNIPENFANNQTAYYDARTEALTNISILVDAYANVMIKNESDSLTETFEKNIKRIEDYINEDLASQLEKLNGGLEGLQKQLDGEVNAWFKSEYPVENGRIVLDIEPIKDWIGTNYELKDNIYELKEGGRNELINHIGDTYTNNEEFVSEEETPLAGKSWKWCDATSMISKISPDECIRVKYTKDDVEKEVYLHWHLVTDNDALRALELAKNAQSTADGKSTIFISIDQDGDRVPNNYKIGDLWIINNLALEYGNFADDQVYTDGDILTANKAMFEKYKASDWSKEVKYTDDTKADEAYTAAQSAQTAANNAQQDALQAQQNLTNYVTDKRIDATEMEFLSSELDEFKQEKIRIVGEDGNGGEASNWEASVSPTNYINAYNIVVRTIEYYTNVNSNEYKTNKYIKIVDNATGETSYKNWSNLSNYYTERQKILNDIATASKNYSDSIKTTAEKADEAAQSAVTMADEARENASIALSQLDAIDNDSLVSKSEFNILESQLKEMTAEVPGIIEMAANYEIDTDDFMDAYACAITAIKYHTGKVYDNFNNVAPFKYADDNNTIVLGIEIVTDTSKDYAYENINFYYTARQIILNAITAAAEAVAKKYTEEKAEQIGGEIDGIKNNINGMNQEIATQLSDIAERYGDLQRQIDGEVTSWFMAGEPEVHCTPSNEWTDEDTKKKHEGDTYTNINSSGKEYKPFDVDFWEQGTISPLIKDEILGKPYSEIKALSSTSIRTKKMLKLEELSYGRITSDNLEYNFHVIFYDNNKKVSNYVYGNVVPIEDNENFSYFSIVAEKATNEEITIEEVENFKFKYNGNEVTYVWSKYVDETAGQSWRWCKCLHYNEIGKQVNDWHWHKIADSDAVKALAEAAKAQFAADGKCKTFIEQPSNYQAGDLWILQSDTDHTLGKTGYILIADQASVTYNANHWKNYVKYTDDTAANAAQQKADAAQQKADNVKAQLDAIDTEVSEAKQAVNELNTSLTDTEDLLNKSLKDGFIDASEKEALRKSLEQIETEYINLIFEYNDVIDSGYLSSGTTSQLESLKSKLETDKTNYITNINTIININSKISVFKPKIDIKTEISNWTFENNYKSPKDQFYNTINEIREKLIDAQNEIRVAITNNAQEFAKNAVNGIKVGGTNLVEKSKNCSGLIYNSVDGNTVTITNTDEYTSVYLTGVGNKCKCIIEIPTTISIDYTKQYTLSFDIKSIGLSSLCKINLDKEKDKNILQNSVVITAGEDWKRLEFTGYVFSGETLNIQRHDFYDTYENSSCTFYIKNIKVEQGNIATDWTSAPEDVDSEIQEAKNSALEVSTALNSTDNLLNKSLEDGYIDANEKEALNKALATLTIEMSGLTKEYGDVYGSIYLTSTQKSTLKSKYDDLNEAYERYKSAITSITNIVISGLSLVKPKIQIPGWDNTKYKTPKSNYETALTNYLSALSTAQTQMRENLNTETKKNINEAIDNIQVGGTNLLKGSASIRLDKWNGSSEFVSNNTNGINTVTYNSNGYLGLYKSLSSSIFPFDIKGKITISLLIKTSNTQNRNLQLVVRGKKTSTTSFTNIVSEYSTYIGYTPNIWHKITLTFELTDTISNLLTNYPVQQGVFLVINQSTKDTTNSGNTVEVKNVKIEEGNIATAWTPAPEDINKEIDEAKDAVSNVSEALTDTESLLNKSLEDGYIDANEKEALNKALAALEVEYSGFTNEYDDIYSSPYLTNQQKADLDEKYIDFVDAYTIYKESVETILSISIIGLSLVKPKIQIPNWGDDKYKTPKSEYEKAFKNLVSAISTAQEQMRVNLNEETKKAINNIQVGGVNLLRNTNFDTCSDGVSYNRNNFTTYWLYQNSSNGYTLTVENGYLKLTSTVTNWNSTSPRMGFYQTKANILGQEYVLSFDAYADTPVYIKAASGYGSWSENQRVQITTTKQRHSIKMIGANGGDSNYKIFFLRLDENIQTSIYFNNFQLEVGNIATEWKPNEADIIEANENILKNSMLIDLGSEQLEKSITKKLKKNTEYVFSVESCSDDAELYLFDQEGANPLTCLECAKNEKKHITFLTPNSENLNVYLSLYDTTISNGGDDGDSSNTSVTVTFYGVKLAEGNKYTPWEGTPEEQQTIMTLNNAMQGSTETKGGLMLTNVIGMKGSVNGTGNDVTAGINGLNTEDVNGMPSDLRFWAGSTSWNDIHSAPFRVYEDGRVYSTKLTVGMNGNGTMAGINSTNSALPRFWAGSSNEANSDSAPFRVYDDGRVFGTHFYGYLSATIITSSNYTNYMTNGCINLTKTGQIIYLDRTLLNTTNFILDFPKNKNYIGSEIILINPFQIPIYACGNIAPPKYITSSNAFESNTSNALPTAPTTGEWYTTKIYPLRNNNTAFTGTAWAPNFTYHKYNICEMTNVNSGNYCAVQIYRFIETYPFKFVVGGKVQNDNYYEHISHLLRTGTYGSGYYTYAFWCLESEYFPGKLSLT